MVRYCLFITLVLFYFPLEAEQMQAQANELQKSHFLKIEHFRLTSGKTFRNLKLHYLTLGKPKYNERHEITNAIMLFHATINDSSSFLQSSLAPFLFNKGAPFDAQKYYIIIPDGIGAGQSSKPSDGLYGQFPVYGYKDQIAASKAVLDSLGVNHLKLVLGTSMGGMLTWLWGETYPDSTDVLIPIVSTPLQVCGRNFIWREMMLAAIRNDPLWLNGNYKLQAVPHVWRDTVGPLNSIMLGTAEMLRGAANTRAAALEEYKQLVNSISSSDPSDWYYIFNSSYDYDPAPGLSKIKAQVLAINFKDDLINPLEFIHIPETGNMHHAVLPGGFGHLSFAHANLWINPVNHFLGNLPEWDKF